MAGTKSKKDVKSNKNPLEKLSTGMIIWLIFTTTQLFLSGAVAIVSLRRLGDMGDGANPMTPIIAFIPVIIIILSIISLLTGRGTRWLTVVLHGAVGTILILMSLYVASQFAKQGVSFPIYGFYFIYSALYFGLSKRVKERFEYYQRLHKGKKQGERRTANKEVKK